MHHTTHCDGCIVGRRLQPSAETHHHDEGWQAAADTSWGLLSKRAREMPGKGLTRGLQGLLRRLASTLCWGILQILQQLLIFFLLSTKLWMIGQDANVACLLLRCMRCCAPFSMLATNNSARRGQQLHGACASKELGKQQQSSTRATQAVPMIIQQLLTAARSAQQCCLR